MSRVDYLVEYILGPCRCHEAYKGRGLVAPDCGRCNDEDEARQALRLAYQYGYDDGPKAKEVVEANREALKELDGEVQWDTEEA